MAFRELNGDFIREFDFFLKIDKECTHNIVWVYTMPFIALAKLDVKNSLTRDNPLEDYEINMEETDRTYLLKGAVEKLMLLKPSKQRYGLVKDLFNYGHQCIISRIKKSDVASNGRLMEIPKRIIEK